MKRCYYDILEVEKKAPEKQIKAAYRKMAMKYHPDKNQTEEGKKVFLQVQQAYDVLADANERTFYDNNREKILFNKDDMSKEDLEEYGYGFNIWEFFSGRCFKGFEDDEAGFFSVYRSVFEKIKAEEMKAYKAREDDLNEEMRKFEGFGTLETPIQKVLKFYDIWQNYTTYKTFVWCQGYDLREAQNRWVKRRMQEQNTKERIKQRKNYIKTIKDLVSFVKKRDTRYQLHAMGVREAEEKTEMEKIKKIEDKKREKEELKKGKSKYDEERFKEIDEYNKNNNTTQVAEEYNGEGEEPEFYCRICNKTFKSENQIINHEKSKSHKENVKVIRKQVMLPGEKLEQALQGTEESETTPQPAKKKRFRKKKNQNNNNPNQLNGEGQDGQKSQSLIKQAEKIPEEQPKEEPKPKKVKKEKKIIQSSQDEADILNFLVHNRTGKGKIPKTIQTDKKDKNQKDAKDAKGKGKKGKKIEVSSSQSEEQQGKPITKAKLKKMKKAEEQKNITGTKCKTCEFAFPTRNQLFEHLDETGHAAFRN